MPKRSATVLRWQQHMHAYEGVTRGQPPTRVPPHDHAAWERWLRATGSFAFYGQAGHMSVVCEARTQHASYWYAYRSVGRQTMKRYLGAGEHVTLARLEELAGELDVAASQKRRAPLAYEPSPLLRPKLQPPQLGLPLVERVRVWGMLDACLSRRLTLLVAPAGFGKTTAIRQWLDERPQRPRLAWVSLDTADNDPIRFWRYLISACQADVPDLGKTALGLLMASLQQPFEPTSLDTAITVLLNELAERQAALLLVLDDFHLITEPSIHSSLALLIGNLPPHMHVVMTTRSLPPLPGLPQWRARGQAAELYSADLRFSPPETRAFVRQNLAATLSDVALAALEQLLEGWPAGLRMVALALHGRAGDGDIEQVIQGARGSAGLATLHHSLIEYLVHEVLDQQPAQIQQFLLATGSLERICASLCDEALGREDSAALLAGVARSGLFLESLGGDGWYRYHALFADALRREAAARLGGAALRAVALRASRWYAAHQMPIEAIESAIAASALDEAADLIERADAQGYVCAPQTLRRWLDLFPRELIYARPALCLILAMILQFPDAERDVQLPQSSAQQIAMALEKAAQGWQSQGNSPWLGVLDAFHALSALRDQAFADAVAHAQRGLDRLGGAAPDRRLRIWCGVCQLIVGLQRLHDGQLEDARQLFLLAHQASLQGSDPHFTRGTQLLLAVICTYEGDRQRAMAYYRQVLPLAKAERHLPHTLDALLGLAGLAFERNDLAAATQLAQEAAEHAASAGQPDHAGVALQRILLGHARDPAGEAAQQLAQLAQRIQHHSAPADAFILPMVMIWQVRLALASGDLAMAEAATHGLRAAEPLLGYAQRLMVQALGARLAYAHGDLAAARQQAEPLWRDACAHQHMVSALELQLLLAMIASAEGHAASAHDWLYQTLAQSQRGGHTRLLLDFGPQATQLLRGALPSAPTPALRSYAQSLIALWDAPCRVALPAAQLSPQELRILALLAAGRTNQQIADALIISLNTVKDHLKHVYHKLDAHTRTQAVAAARRLRLVD